MSAVPGRAAAMEGRPLVSVPGSSQKLLRVGGGEVLQWAEGGRREDTEGEHLHKPHLEN